MASGDLLIYRPRFLRGSHYLVQFEREVGEQVCRVKIVHDPVHRRTGHIANVWRAELAIPTEEEIAETLEWEIQR